jgi:hypothetical protein
MVNPNFARIKLDRRRVDGKFFGAIVPRALIAFVHPVASGNLHNLYFVLIAARRASYV